MAYTKQNWENLPSTNTPITADRLNHMEDGIYNAYEINTSYSTSDTKGYSCGYINSVLSNLLLTQTQSITVGNISGGGEKFDQVTDITIPTGYTALGIVGYSISGVGYTRAFLSRLDISSNKDKILWSIRNSSSDALSNINISITLLFVKS